MQSTHRYNSYLYEPVRITRIRITPKNAALRNPSFTNKISKLPESNTATAGVIRPCSSHPCSRLGAYNSARPDTPFQTYQKVSNISPWFPGVLRTRSYNSASGYLIDNSGKSNTVYSYITIKEPGYGHPLPDFSAIHTLSGSAQKFYPTSRSRLQNRKNLCVLDQVLCREFRGFRLCSARTRPGG